MLVETDFNVNEVRTARSRKFQPWIDVFLGALLWLISLLVNFGGFIHPHRLGFFCDDQSIRYKNLPETVPFALLSVFTIALPFASILVMEFSTHWSVRKQVESAWYRVAAASSAKFIGLYWAGYIAQEVVVDCMRFSYGRLRPHFLDVCRPDFSRINCSQGYIEEYECTSGMHPDVIEIARESFPSGHATMSFYVAVFLVYYLHRRLTTEYSLLLKLVINVALFSVATYISITRITDNAHHVTDVIAGAAIGVFTAISTALYLLESVDWVACAPTDESIALKNTPLTRCYGTGGREGGVMAA